MLLQEKDRQAVQKRFEELDKPVRLVNFTQDPFSFFLDLTVFRRCWLACLRTASVGLLAMLSVQADFGSCFGFVPILRGVMRDAQ